MAKPLRRLLTGLLSPYDEHGAVGVAYHRVGDAAEQSSPEAPEPPASQDDKVGVRIVGKPHYLLVRIAERKVGIGADPRLLDNLFHYYQSPGVTLSEESVESMLLTVCDVGPALVVFDSWVDFLALNGLNENDSVDVTRWVLSIAYPLRQMGAATLLLDHVNKDGSGKGGRGSSAKLAKLDAGYKLVKNKDYDRQGMGKVTLTRDKDRPAALERSMSFAVGGDGTGRIRVVPNAQILCAADEPTPNEYKMLAVLTLGMRHGEWHKASGLAKSSFNAGRDRLLRMGLVEKRGGLYVPASATDMKEAA